MGLKFFDLMFRLNLLFCGLNPKSHPRYEIYLTLIECAEKMGVLNEVITAPKKVGLAFHIS